MKFKNHIANRFLTDNTLLYEMFEVTFRIPKGGFKDPVTKEEYVEYMKRINFINWHSKEESVNYVVTKSIIEKIEKIHVSIKEGVYDWTIFKDIGFKKLTFILPGNVCIRIYKGYEDSEIKELSKELCICHVQYFKNDSEQGEAKWVDFWVDTTNNNLCDHFKHKDVKNCQDFIYKLLVFFFFAENQEIILSPGESNGTRKTEKVKNDLPVELKIIDNNWNITSIRKESFGVSGHFALRAHGIGRKKRKLVFIEPYQKKGYVRKSKKDR